jgi:hypothetical protein
MIVGALLYAAGLATAVLYLRRTAAKGDRYARYRDPETGLLSARRVREAKGR